jgi:hypothetical protein
MFATLREFTKLGADFTSQIGGGVDAGHEEGSWLGSATQVAINNATTENQEVSFWSCCICTLLVCARLVQLMARQAVYGTDEMAFCSRP